MYKNLPPTEYKLGAWNNIKAVETAYFMYV